MTKPTDLADQLSDAAGAAFAALGLDAALGAMRRSDRPDLADFQCNGAMAAAKKLGKNPREIATAIVEALKASPLVAVDRSGRPRLHQREALGRRPCRSAPNRSPPIRARARARSKRRAAS